MISKIITQLQKEYNVLIIDNTDPRHQKFKITLDENLKYYAELEISTISNVFCDLQVYSEEKKGKSFFYDKYANEFTICKNIIESIPSLIVKNSTLKKVENKKELRYFYEKLGKKIGPLTLEEIKSLNLKNSDIVWRSDMNDWTKASFLEELKFELIPTPPLLPNEKKELEKADTIKSVFNTLRIIFGILCFISGVGGIIGYFARINTGTFQGVDLEKIEINFRYSILIFLIALFLLFYKKMKGLFN